MPITGIRRIRTPFDKTAKKDSETVRIRIPQPVDRPITVRSKDVVRDDYLQRSPWWFTLHKRGLKRTRVGLDYLESRAISRERVRGTLPERIIYLYLVSRLHMKEGFDFTFQTSLQGGRLELGGIVADFLFPIMKMIINPHGPTHREFLQRRKDEEQRAILEDMGYRVYDMTDLEVYNEPIFEDKMLRIFNLRGGGGAADSQQQELVEGETDSNESYDDLISAVELLDMHVDELGVAL